MRYLQELLLPISKLTRCFLLGALLESFCLGTLAHGGDAYTVQALTIPRNAFSGQASAINADGTAVGWSYDAAGLLHAVKWDASGVLTDLNPSGAISEALAINDAGDVVGWVFPAGGSASHAYLWRHDGVEIDLQTLGGPGSQAFGVNNGLAIVGVSDRPSPLPPVAFIWKPATGMRDLGMGANS